MYHALYLLIMAALALAVPATVFVHAGGVILVIGVIGVWRYSWSVVNVGRAIYYTRITYPRRRAAAEIAYQAAARPTHAFFLVTTYKIDPAVTTRVYRSLFTAASNSAGGATIVASVVDRADERLIKLLFEIEPQAKVPVTLIVDRIPGSGKRDALATALRRIAGQCPTWRDIVLFVDGDSCVPEDIVVKAAPFFCDQRTGALTTDEACEIEGSPLFRDWYALRFTQRQMMMSSVALSGRVLTLTGRMSVVRADLATNPEFISAVQHDFIDHWRLGRIKFLTGDDKSTWYWLLKSGYEMAYLPDVQCLSMESQPNPGFVDSAVTLMIRWFGNMLRTNSRALRLSPSKIGWFTWWSILDQRVSMWTTLVGPVGVLTTAIFFEPMIVVVYAAWVMFTRYAYCWVLAIFRGPFPVSYPILLYFGQIGGALVKSYVLFRLDRQRWTRQSASSVRLGGVMARVRTLSSVYLHVLALGWLIVAVFWMTSLGADASSAEPNSKVSYNDRNE
ncbi:mannuronan synthase [soil metagenome]